MTDSPRAIVALWPSPEAMAIDVGATPSAVRKWTQRGSIPVGFWSAIIHAAIARGFAEVSYEGLALMHARRAADDDAALAAEARS